MELFYSRLLYRSLNATLKINRCFCSFLMYCSLFLAGFFFPSSSKHCQKYHTLELVSLTLRKTGLILPTLTIPMYYPYSILTHTSEILYCFIL